MKKVTTSTLLKMKQENTKITALTAYDASFAKLFDEQGIDVLLIGDSLGMVLKGDDDTLSVTLEDIAPRLASSKAVSVFAVALAVSFAFASDGV